MQSAGFPPAIAGWPDVLVESATTLRRQRRISANAYMSRNPASELVCTTRPLLVNRSITRLMGFVRSRNRLNPAGKMSVISSMPG